MANFYFTDADGTKQGPLTPEQIQALAKKGIIKPDTMLESDAGHTGKAGQIPGLKFPAQATQGMPPSDRQSAPAVDAPKPNTYSVAQVRYRSDTEATSISELLLDRSFRELRPETVFLWIMKIAYFVGVIGLILYTLIQCGSTIYETFAFIFQSIPERLKNDAEAIKEFNAEKRSAFVAMLGAVPYLVICCVLGVFVLRFVSEWLIIIFHYMLVWTIEATKVSIEVIKEIPRLIRAFRIFLENWSKSKREK